jgi:hypothetical protein
MTEIDVMGTRTCLAVSLCLPKAFFWWYVPGLELELKGRKKRKGEKRKEEEKEERKERNLSIRPFKAAKRVLPVGTVLRLSEQNTLTPSRGHETEYQVAFS